jgi:serine phosphatase RsbU (regulator of sigma subunit)
MLPTDTRDLTQLISELENFQEIAKYLLPRPGDVPRLQGIDVCGGMLPLTGVVGGDHIIYVDFKRRFDLPARIEHAMAKGKLEVAENLRQCQRVAGIALLDMFGQITKRLFENLNTRFYKSSGAHKFVSMIYGEISEAAKFRFLSAGQPFPAVFSNEHNRFMEVSPVSFPPLGILPSLGVIDRSTTKSPLGFKDHYELNEWTLMGAGDILLLCTDGLVEHSRGGEAYFPGRLEETMRQVKHEGATAIFEAIKRDLLEFNAPSDDISVVVIKRT